MYVAKVGNIRVPVYKINDGRHCVIWRQFAGGERKRETFVVKKEATDRSEEIARALANSQADVLTLTSADRDSYRLAMQELAPLGIQLHAAVSEYVAARKAIPGYTLSEAVKYFGRAVVERRVCPPTVKVLEELLDELNDDRREGRKYVKPLKRELDRFAAAHPSLPDVTEEDIRRYLGGLKLLRAAKGRRPGDLGKQVGDPVSARRRDNVREVIVRLFRFARKKQYLPEDKTSPAERIPRQSEGGDVTTYNPEQLSQILNHFAKDDPDWLPWAVLAAFAGLRTSEILRLEWWALKWESGVVAVPRSVARKVRTSRLPPFRMVDAVEAAEGRPARPVLQPLVTWLEAWRDARGLTEWPTGYVIPRKWKDMEAAQCDAIDRLKRALKWDRWYNNALRHSFGSNRLAIVKSFAQVAYEMGNSPKKVQENYNDPKPEVEALRYFSVVPPESVKNVVKASFRAQG